MAAESKATAAASTSLRFPPPSSTDEERKPEVGVMTAAEAEAMFRPKGYPFLARFWAQTQTGMARKFKRLAALNILYLQAELSHLERELERQRHRDLETGRPERGDCDWNWLLLSEPALHRGSRQWEVALEIRDRLGEYCVSKPSLISPCLRISTHHFICFSILEESFRGRPER